MAGKKITSEHSLPLEDPRRIFSLIAILLVIWSGVRLFFTYVSVPELWGFNIFDYLPGKVAIVLTCISLFGIGIGFLRTRSDKKKAAKRSTATGEATSGSWVIIALIAAAFGLLFMEFLVAWPFLGDGTMYMGMLYNFHESGTITTQRTSAPVLYLIYGIYHLYLELTKEAGDSFFPFAIVSLLSGLIFTVTALRFAQVFDQRRWLSIVFFSVLISLGGSLFFFGYVEVYPLQYACVLVYAYLAFRYITGRAGIVPVGAVLILRILFHLQNALLIPSFVFLYSLRSVGDREGADRSRMVLRVVLISIPLLLVCYILSQTVLLDLLSDDVGSPFIPFSASGHAFYTLLAGRHLLDIVNYHALIAGVPILLIIACVAARSSSVNWKQTFVLFLLLNLFFFEAFLFGGGFSFGLARDWDVCASLGIFISLLALSIFRQIVGEHSPVRRYALPISVVSLCGVIGWITININSTAAATRYSDLLDLYAPTVEKKITSRGYENLRKYQQTTDLEAELVTIRKMLELYPTPADARQVMIIVSNQPGLSDASAQEVLRMTEILNSQSDSILKQETFDKVRVGDPHAEQAATLGDFFGELLIFLHKPINALTLEQALNRCQEFIDKHPSLPYGYETYGYLVTTYTQKPADAVAYLKRAVGFDSLRARPQFYAAVALNRAGQREEALMRFRRALQLDPEAKWGLNEYGVVLTKQTPTPQEVVYLKELQKFLTEALTRPPKSSLHVQQHEADKAYFLQLLEKVRQRIAEVS